MPIRLRPADHLSRLEASVFLVRNCPAQPDLWLSLHLHSGRFAEGVPRTVQHEAIAIQTLPFLVPSSASSPKHPPPSFIANSIWATHVTSTCGVHER